MSKIYKVLLDSQIIGTTLLEKADAPMGVVFGNISFVNTPSAYNFLKNYCLNNNIDFTDCPKDKLISTVHIPGLQVMNPDEIEIKGLASSISGMEGDVFEVTIEGIRYPFYEKEFPHYVNPYIAE